MKAEWYLLEITEGGVFGLVHKISRTINEIFIPSLSISINIVDGMVNCFKTNSREERYTDNSNTKLIKKIELPDDLSSVFSSYFNSKTELDERAKELFRSLKIS